MRIEQIKNFFDHSILIDKIIGSDSYYFGSNSLIKIAICYNLRSRISGLFDISYNRLIL